MAVHIEAQDNDTYQQVRARETQLDNIEKLENINEVVNNMDLDAIESTTNDIKSMVVDNLEAQPNLDELLDTLNKVAQGVTDIKRNQTNINKKINELQDTVDQINGDNDG